ncbi:MAG: hypothetical protein ACR2N9_07815 [Acidimicrobiia bacterium]
MPVKFLSPAWFDTVRAIRVQHAEVHGAVATYRTNHTVTNVPDQGTVEFHVDLGDDIFYEPGHVDGADLSVTYDYATARAIYLDRSIRLEELRDAAGDDRVTFVGDPVIIRDYWTDVVGHPGHLGMFDDIAEATE